MQTSQPYKDRNREYFPHHPTQIKKKMSHAAGDKIILQATNFFTTVQPVSYVLHIISDLVKL